MLVLLYKHSDRAQTIRGRAHDSCSFRSYWYTSPTRAILGIRPRSTHPSNSHPRSEREIGPHSTTGDPVQLSNRATANPTATRPHHAMPTTRTTNTVSSRHPRKAGSGWTTGEPAKSGHVE